MGFRDSIVHVTVCTDYNYRGQLHMQRWRWRLATMSMSMSMINYNTCARSFCGVCMDRRGGGGYRWAVADGLRMV